MQKEEVERVIREISRGDKTAEEELCRTYRPRILFQLQYNLGRDNQDCEDLANEICMALLIRLRRGGFRPDGLEPYVYGIIQRKRALYFRKRGRIGELRSDEIPSHYPDLSPTAAERMEERERFKALDEAMDELSPECRKVLYFYYYEKLSIGEISGRLHIPPRRVSELKYYALKKMRVRLKEGQ